MKAFEVVAAIDLVGLTRDVAWTGYDQLEVEPSVEGVAQVFQFGLNQVLDLQSHHILASIANQMSWTEGLL